MRLAVPLANVIIVPYFQYFIYLYITCVVLASKLLEIVKLCHQGKKL